MGYVIADYNRKGGIGKTNSLINIAAQLAMNGKKVIPNSITRMFHTFLRQKGMGHIRFHDLRHTAATLLANNGTQLKVLQNFLGHNDVKVTLGVYTHDPENAGAQAASSMGQVFEKTFCSETCSERQLLAQEIERTRRRVNARPLHIEQRSAAGIRHDDAEVEDTNRERERSRARLELVGEHADDADEIGRLNTQVEKQARRNERGRASGEAKRTGHMSRPR